MALSKYHNQQHFEPLLSEHRVGMAGGHEDGLALVEDVLHAVHGDAPLAVQTQHQRVAAGLVGADLLSLVSKANSVTLTASFCASVLLTT